MSDDEEDLVPLVDEDAETIEWVPAPGARTFAERGRAGLGRGLDALRGPFALDADESAPPVPGRRRGRGLLALIPDSLDAVADAHVDDDDADIMPAAIPPAPAPQVSAPPPVDQRPALADEDVHVRLERSWLVIESEDPVAVWPLHHHHPLELTITAAHDLTVGGLSAPAAGVVHMICGATATAVGFPGPLDADPMHGRPRCDACCAALGVPAGYGSPGGTS